MLTRERVLEAVYAVTADWNADEVSIRDIVVKDSQASLTVLTPGGAALPPLEAALREALAGTGAETVHLRFRPLEAPAGGGGTAAAGAQRSGRAGCACRRHSPRARPRGGPGEPAAALRAQRHAVHRRRQRQGRRRQVHRHRQSGGGAGPQGQACRPDRCRHLWLQRARYDGHRGAA